MVEFQSQSSYKVNVLLRYMAFFVSARVDSLYGVPLNQRDFFEPPFTLIYAKYRHIKLGRWVLMCGLLSSLVLLYGRSYQAEWRVPKSHCTCRFCSPLFLLRYHVTRLWCRSWTGWLRFTIHLHFSGDLYCKDLFFGSIFKVWLEKFQLDQLNLDIQLLIGINQ